MNYSWNAANQLVSVTDNRAGGVTTAAYTATGQPRTLAQPSSVGAMYSYDARDRVTSLAWQRGANPAFGSWSYDFNSRGQRTNVTDATGRQVAYGYDAISRLANETVTSDPRGSVGDGEVLYSLDPAGNRLTRTSTLAALGAQMLTYDSNDQLATDAYDVNGNTTSSNGHTYGYDFENRLRSKDSGAVTIVYDGDGNRVAKTVGGATTKYLVDDLNPTGYLQVLEEVATGGVQREYTYGTMLVSQTRQPGPGALTSYYGYDAARNVTFLTDNTGAVTDSYEYDSSGNIVNSVGTTPNSRKYASEELDSDLGLINLRTRYYSPENGRFTTADSMPGSVERPRTYNRYVYGIGDPQNWRDPTGHDAEQAGLNVALAAPLEIPAEAVAVAPTVVATDVGLLIQFKVIIAGGVLASIALETDCALSEAASGVPLAGQSTGICRYELKSCSTDYPAELVCDPRPPNYKFDAPQDALNAFVASSGRPLVFSSNQDPTNTNNPDAFCKNGHGYHVDVSASDTGERAGSIVCCDCCKETYAGPFFPVHTCAIQNPRSGFKAP